jgi:hypothetical protein
MGDEQKMLWKEPKLSESNEKFCASKGLWQLESNHGGEED